MQKLQYLRRILEVPKSSSVAALRLELGILPIQFEIEKRQLLFPKVLLEKMQMIPSANYIRI